MAHLTRCLSGTISLGKYSETSVCGHINVACARVGEEGEGALIITYHARKARYARYARGQKPPLLLTPFSHRVYASTPSIDRLLSRRVIKYLRSYRSDTLYPFVHFARIAAGTFRSRALLHRVSRSFFFPNSIQLAALSGSLSIFLVSRDLIATNRASSR